jgi:GNAT superfamily N-acetyltransferase
MYPRAVIEIHPLDETEQPDALPQLSELLVACVRGGASVEFLASVTTDDADAYWRGAFERVASGQQVFVVAKQADRIVGTVSLVLVPQQNQQHRAEISKLLVDPTVRRQGIADRLMEEVEAEAWRRGLTMLVLDTVTGSDASRVYERRDWHRAGDIPNYALDPAGQMCSTTFYWKAGSSDASTIT